MSDVERLILSLFRSMGIEKHYLNPEVSELMVSAEQVFIERNGKIEEVPEANVNDRKLRSSIEIIGRSIGDEIDDYHKPWLDSRMPDGSRVAATYPPISPEGVVLTIRKFVRHFTTDELLERRALSFGSFSLIVAAVHARKNILFSGSTSSGKTTMTNAFVQHIPAHERIVVIEKPMEIKIQQQCRVRFESYPPVADRPEVSVSQLLSLTLRHRPDRIIVGEVKDTEAAYGLLQAMNTGHDGTISTIHSNTAESALRRMASLAMPKFGDLDLARQETAAAIDLVVEVRRDASGWRGVAAILEVGDYDNHSRKFETTEVYRRSAAQGA